jgi:Asp/Glu/hydantoin racemase
MIDFLSGRTVAILYMLWVALMVFLVTVFTIRSDEKLKQIQTLESEIRALKAHVTEIETVNKSCSATLQACLGSCIESQLLDTVKESIRIKR